MAFSRSLHHGHKTWHYLVLVLFFGIMAVFSNMVWHGSRNYAQETSIEMKNFNKSGLYGQGEHDFSYYPVNLVSYKKDTPLVWIGGTTDSVMAVVCNMLNAQPDIHCTAETRMISLMLYTHAFMEKSMRELETLIAAKITVTVLNQALGAYILTILSQNGKPVSRICNQDPHILKYMSKLLDIFPKSKFILIKRDKSTKRRRSVVRGKDTRWNRLEDKASKKRLKTKRDTFDQVTMSRECQRIGPQTCLSLLYRDLIHQPQASLQEILNFLDVMEE